MIPANLPIKQSATCRIKKTFAVNYHRRVTNAELNAPERIYYSLGEDEDEADTVTFIDLDTKNPKVQSNGGQATLVVTHDDEKRITLVNIQFGGAEMYTIFKSKGVVIYSQQKESLLIGPFGAFAMGYCN